MGEAQQGLETEEVVQVGNLYVHFPFCRRKCTYCALHSRAGMSEASRAAYVGRLAALLSSRQSTAPFFTLPNKLKTVYFGGGSPALCDLAPLFKVLGPHLSDETEFTVELHPLDATTDTLKRLKDGGVNRISMGVQSLDDAILSMMGRGYTFHDAERAFYRIREHFENAGIDLIVGYPGEECALSPRHARLAKWGLAHCSVYSLILEEKSILANQVRRKVSPPPPDDDTTLNRLSIVAAFLKEIGLNRYEIANYAAPQRECRHNFAVWRGEDYVGLGEGAHGRIGRLRFQDFGMDSMKQEEVSPDADMKERTLFRLRTREGLDASAHPEWLPTLESSVKEGLLTRIGTGSCYKLTERGTEVCDAILTELI